MEEWEADLKRWVADVDLLRRLKTQSTTNSLALIRRPVLMKLERLSENLQLNTILTAAVIKKSSRNSKMLTKFFQIRKNVIFMTSMVRRDSKTAEDMLDMVWMTFLEVSSGWAAAEDSRVVLRR